MDLRDALLDLVSPLRLGDEIAPGARLVDVSTETGPGLAFDVRGRTVCVDVSPLGTDRYAARSARFAFSYRTEGGRNPVDPRLGLALCQAVADRVRPNEERVSATLSRSDPPSAVTTRVREVRVDHMLEPAGQGDESFYKLSPYVGCLIGCRYCYAQTPVALTRRLEALPEAPWGSYVDVRINASEVLAAELARRTVRPIKFCPIVSDPYQAVEPRYGITRACLEAIRAAATPWPTLVLTRSKLVTRDVDLFAALPLAWVGASIPTADDEVRQKFEPRAASISERLSALATLRRAGARTFAVVQPMLPGSVDGLADALASVVSSVSIDVLRGEEQAGADFDDPRYSEARTEGWQRDRARELASALAARDIAVWPGELPGELLAPSLAR